ncbi:hypothetical protein OnM2_014040 [Erysiphe neolycopersici]|uniref:Uncharacterized protein n=1 Tax=Erysiphe neolycopersici TaxID=212602 RepID=A0A420I5M1_9PEZI|nr:hypothetical protein OnM2_014040 [Erysiphe neolycopersici]
MQYRCEYRLRVGLVQTEIWKSSGIDKLPRKPVDWRRRKMVEWLGCCRMDMAEIHPNNLAKSRLNMLKLCCIQVDQ